MPLASSFRDPAGFLFWSEGLLLRQVSPEYAHVLNRVVEYGLYGELVAGGMLIPHTTVADPTGASNIGTVFLQPEFVHTISYPYEWCFSQFKDAALVTLEIQRRAVQKGLSLKDASAFNIQFHRGKPTLIDSLSFEPYIEGQPWKAYRQFCEHFLAPLALMAHVDARLSKLLRIHIDGIPLDMASRMLPARTRFSAGLSMHIHLHARAQKKSRKPRGGGSFSRAAMMGLIDSLSGTVEKLQWSPQGTVWGDYYKKTNYSDESFNAKRNIVHALLGQVDPLPTSLWDLGANTGEFSGVAAEHGIRTVAWDVDEAAVEKHYLQRRGDPNLLPLLVDLTNPSPNLGWAGEERDSFQKRCNADVVMALALIHHLAIGNNVPLDRLSSFYASLSPWLLIEFVPKTDSQVERLLESREDIYANYHEEGFVAAFGRDFEVVQRRPIPGNERVLFLLKRL
jgi:hypothetical protein